MLKRYTPFISALVVALVYGMASERFTWFPSPQVKVIVKQAMLALELFDGSPSWYYVEAEGRQLIEDHQPQLSQPGLTLLTGVGPEDSLFIRTVEANGEVVHQWDIDWYELWPEANHIPDHLIPRGKPGTHLHGSRLMGNGDIVFNFENLGLVRLNICSKLVFKLAYPTHHSVFVDEQGNFWLPGQIYHQQKLEEFPYYDVPFKDDTIVMVSSTGKLLSEVSVMRLLKDNGYEGLMYMSTISSRKPSVTGDVYHLNDVEVFPSTMAEGVFKHGDVMVSLRNTNTVFVYDPKTLKIRYLTAGKFVRQHDPDFVDGNTISVFDNYHVAHKDFGHKSKILLISAIDGSVTSYLKGENELEFYSNIMGKHQWLDNGNLLVLESRNGRVFEVTPQKQRVWQYSNLIVNTSMVGVLEGAERLPAQFDRAFFDQLKLSCH
jgi:hypothetical protein